MDPPLHVLPGRGLVVYAVYPEGRRKGVGLGDVRVLGLLGHEHYAHYPEYRRAEGRLYYVCRKGEPYHRADYGAGRGYERDRQGGAEVRHAFFEEARPGGERSGQGDQ